MTRKRVCPVGYPQHVIQRGNNKQVCFFRDQDRKAYLYWLIKYSRKFKVDIHAWVLMDNHVHLLCTPNDELSLSKMMQSLGRMYVQNFNHQYKRTGTLWEGRFKSFVIESQRYLLEVYRYIELNPVRAGIVTSPVEYSWSSYLHNAYGANSNLITKHDEYLNLGNSMISRQKNYRRLFDDEDNQVNFNNIRKSIKTNLVLGSNSFINKLESKTKHRFTNKKAGRRWA